MPFTEKIKKFIPFFVVLIIIAIVAGVYFLFFYESYSSTITFSSDWKQNVEGIVAPNLKVAVQYDAKRLFGEELNNASRVLMYVKNGDGSNGEVQLKGNINAKDSFAKGSFNVSAGGENIELWFKGIGKDGAEVYDSNFSKNFSFSINKNIIE